MHLHSFTGSQRADELCDSGDESDGESKGPVLTEVEEEELEAVVARLPSRDLGRSAAQTQGFHHHSPHKQYREEYILPV